MTFVNINTMTLDKQMEELIPVWAMLVAGLIPQIEDEFRATDDPDDDTPAMQLTVGFTPATDVHDYSWHYQTGDNSFSGGAYLHPHWAVVTILRDSNPEETAEEIATQLSEAVVGW